MTPVINEITRMNNEVLSEIRKMKPFDLISNFQSLVQDFNKVEILQNELKDFIEIDIIKVIDNHTEAYSEKQFDEIVIFVNTCNIFSEKINRYTYVANVVIQSLSVDESDLKNEFNIIDIQVNHSDNDINAFLNFLTFLDQIYSKSCQAFEIHYEDFPLTIIKIESGSIWSRLSGNEKMLELISDLITKLSGFVRDLITGKISLEQFENKVKKAEIVLDLMVKANGMGLPPEKKVLLEKVFESAVSDFAKSLPKSTTSITLNDNIVLQVDTTEQKKITGGKKALREKNEDTNEKTNKA